MATKEPWFPYRKPIPYARRRLFCLPPASASASLFRSWPAHLTDAIEVCAAQLPGREERIAEPLIDRMAPVIAALAPAIEQLLDLPYAFFGTSMGGLIAFEMFRHLKRKGRPLPTHFIVAATPAPHFPDTDPHHLLPDAPLVAELRKEGGVPEEALNSPEFLKLLLPIVRADAAVTETYRYSEDEGVRLDCPIIAFSGDGDTKVPQERVEAWRDYTTGSFQHITLPGDHMFIRSTTEQVTRMIRQQLLG